MKIAVNSTQAAASQYIVDQTTARIICKVCELHKTSAMGGKRTLPLRQHFFEIILTDRQTVREVVHQMMCG